MFEKYQQFVEFKTSNESKFSGNFVERFDELASNSLGINIPSLLTSSAGISAEAGEYTEIVKKIMWQQKSLNEGNIYHMKRELGDILFYLAMACTAVGTSLEEIMTMNTDKLTARYKEGFTVEESEVRVAGDI